MSKLVDKEHLSLDEANAFMNSALAEEWTDAQLGGFLMALASKGATGNELAGFAKAMRTHGVGLTVPYSVVDTCGTGGGSSSFNISTGAAIVLAACGVKVAKHGNRAVTSACGSADVLEELGVRISGEPETAIHLLDTVGIVFLFAPQYHPALKAIGKIRRELQIRTVFNQLGPLANPANAETQVIGVYQRSLLQPMAEAMVQLGIRKGVVAHGRDGLDEVSPCAITDALYIEEGHIREMTFEPKDFGIDSLTKAEIAPGGSLTENADLLNSALEGNSGRSSALVPSASVALWLVRGGELMDAAEEVKTTLQRGRAKEKLQQLIEVSSAK